MISTDTGYLSLPLTVTLLGMYLITVSTGLWHLFALESIPSGHSIMGGCPVAGFLLTSFDICQCFAYDTSGRSSHISSCPAAARCNRGMEGPHWRTMKTCACSMTFHFPFCPISKTRYGMLDLVMLGSIPVYMFHKFNMEHHGIWSRRKITACYENVWKSSCSLFSLSAFHGCF